MMTIRNLQINYIDNICRYGEDSEEDLEDRGDMLCDNMMSSYGLNSQEALSRHSQDSLARISSMTNSISPPLHSHGSLSPGKSF